MRAFTISEESTDPPEGNFVKVGVVVTNSEAGPGLRIGEESATIIPVCQKGAEEFKKLTTQSAKKNLGVVSLVTPAVDITKDPLELVEEDGHSNAILVHMAMCAGENGRLWLEGAGLVEEYDEERDVVRRRPREFPGAGISVIAIGVGPLGEPQGLFRMAPGAGFRIRRNGNLAGLKKTLDVKWDGRHLRVSPPDERKR